jgi:hypothetical protein
LGGGNAHSSCGGRAWRKEARSATIQFPARYLSHACRSLRAAEDPNAGKSEHPLDGHSIKPFLSDPVNGKWDGPDVALVAVFGNANPAPEQYHNFSVRSRRWRYTLYENGAEELYDHQADPNEWTNLAKEAAHASTKLN